MTAKRELLKRLSSGRTVRRSRASLRAELRQGHIHIREVLEDPPDALHNCYVYVLLLDTPKLGQKGLRKVLEQAGVYPLDMLGVISKEEREAIYYALPERVRNLS